MNHLGIDVTTKDKSPLVVRLRTLVSTIVVTDGGAYREDPAYSQVFISTHLTEQKLEDWLYASGLEYVGVFSRKDAA